jgi:PhnB protein
MKSVNAYIHFEGNCRAAMSFYQKCLGGELQLATYPDASGTADTEPSEN